MNFSPIGIALIHFGVILIVVCEILVIQMHLKSQQERNIENKRIVQSFFFVYFVDFCSNGTGGIVFFYLKLPTSDFIGFETG